MINLIPPSAKRRIILEYWTRAVSVWFYIWASALLLGAFTLIPAYVLVDLQVEHFSESASSAVEKIASYDAVSQQLDEANRNAKALIDSTRYKLLSDYIALFSSLEDDAVTLSHINISRVKENFGPVQIAGSASTRQALADFRKRLLALPQIDSVDLPISNLAKDKDIQFDMTVKIKP